ncbi:hypothetical protein MTP03_25220 [Tsukamurella sp. PLM1]|nr:hypothetical protein MTP03_25220 [Tsukamurella sp. PLM1]
MPTLKAMLERLAYPICVVFACVGLGLLAAESELGMAWVALAAMAFAVGYARKGPGGGTTP